MVITIVINVPIAIKAVAIELIVVIQKVADMVLWFKSVIGISNFRPQNYYISSDFATFFVEKVINSPTKFPKTKTQATHNKLLAL